MTMATGCPDVQSNVEAMKMGALAYLAKPVDLDSLKTLMRGTALAAAQIQ